MANEFNKAKTWAKEHPWTLAGGVGVIGLLITIYIVNRNKSNSSSTSPASNVSNCTDQYGNSIDCASGAPLGQVSNSPATTGDLTAQIQDLEQVLSGFTTMLQTNNSTGSTTNTTPGNPFGTITVPAGGETLPQIAALYGAQSPGISGSAVDYSIIAANKTALKGYQNNLNKLIPAGTKLTLPNISSSVSGAQ